MLNMVRSYRVYFKKKCSTMQWQIQDLPLGGRQPVGGANLQHRCFLVKMYAKMKELGPVGACARHVP